MSQSLIDAEILLQIQNHFCNANDIYVECLDRDRHAITSFGKCEAMVGEFWREKITLENWDHLLDMAEMSQVEAIVEEPLEEDYLKLCSIVTRVDDTIVLMWVVAGVISEKLTPEVELPERIRITTEERFYRAAAFLESVAKYMMVVREQKLVAEEAMRVAQTTMEENKLQMQRSQVMTDVVTKLDSKRDIPSVVREILQEVCELLHIEGACLLKEHPESQTIEVVCEYSGNRDWNLSNLLNGQPLGKVPFLDGRPYMLSSDSMMPESMERFFMQYHLNAGIFQPVEIKDEPNAYLCFYEFEQERTWKVDDIKLIGDVRRGIRGFLTKHFAQKALEDSHGSLEAILEHVVCGIYVADYETDEVLYLNQNFYDMFHISRECSPKEVGEKFFRNVHEREEFGPREWFLKQTGRWADIRQSEITWIDGRKVFLGTVYDINDKKEYQGEIEKQIGNDTLTGLYNRVRAEADLNEYMKESLLSGEMGALLRIDLDDFQNINAGLGHQYGDQLLKAIGYNLKQIPGIENTCYRVGGDEFAVIVFGQTYKELERILEDLKALFEKPWLLKGTDYYCTMSMSVVCFPTDSDEVNDLIKKSDMVLRNAKKKGKNKVEYYNEKVEDTTFYRLDLEKNMRRAVRNGCKEFEVYYQPIMDQNKPGSLCCGAEALVRWNSAELGFVTPGDFIPLAEYLGLINPIGEYVLREAAKRCKYWNDCGHPDYKVNVNLSVTQLLQNDFVDIVEDVLRSSGITPKNLTLEVTESLAINDMSRMSIILERIKSLGVHVALDDFGTGYSSLNHIRQMPIDVIKIDRCFVENLSEDEFAGAFVKMVGELARTIGVTVCAEGVEERRQLEVLKDMNVRLIQGYYYGKPMQAQEFERMYL